MFASTVSFAKDSPESLLNNALPYVRADRSDLNVRPSRWETRMMIPAVEQLMEDPLQTPGVTENWSGRLEKAQSLSDMIRLWADVRGISLKLPTRKGWTRPPLVAIQGLPPEIVAAIDRILVAIEQAKKPLQKAVDSMSPRERAEAIETITTSIFNDPEKRLESKTFDAMPRFDDASLVRAALLVTQSAEEAIPTLMKHSDGLNGFPRTRLHLPAGDVLISGTGDDVYTADDLKDVALLLDFGGKNRYEAPVAAAGANQIRVAIDLGTDVTVETSSAVSAGSGVLGIGLLYLPNPKGNKRISAGDISLGAGLFGAGGLWVRGDEVRLEGNRFTQGAGALGVGVLSSQARVTNLSARLAGQGFGYSRGAGIFIHQGNKAQLTGGLYYPDGHESSAAISFCQGAGYGPRAFAAGGLGLAMVRGDGNVLESSYNAQGSGYWHGFGGLFILGNGNKLIGRRYDQGAGIHTAVGVLKIRGDENETVNWGVGPAFGWDNGVGLLLLDGDDNTLGAQWASGKGDVNGHGLAVVRGNDNRLSLVDFGTGIFKRRGPSYGIMAAQGRDNRLRTPSLPEKVRGNLEWATTPWGVVVGRGSLDLDPSVKPLEHTWPAFDRTEKVKKEHAELSARFEATKKLSGPRRAAELLSIASGGSLDNEFPFRALQELFALAAKEIPGLLRIVDSDHFDEMIWRRPLIASFGANAKTALLREMAAAHGIRRVLLLGFLRYESVSDAIPEILPMLTDHDWRVRGDAAGILGYLLDREQGNEPGRLRMISEMLAAAQRGELPKADSPAEKEMLGHIGSKALIDILGFLALDPDFSTAEKWAVFQKDPNPADSISPAAIREAAGLVVAHKDRYAPIFKREQTAATRWENRVRAALHRRLLDRDLWVRQIGLLSLGQIGNREDAALIARYLEAQTGGQREAAAVALAKMGPAAKDALSDALKSKRTLTRAMAAVSIAQTWDPDVFALLRPAMRDPEEPVRLAAVAGFSQTQNALQENKKQFAGDLRELAEKDPSLSVRASAANALASIPK